MSKKKRIIVRANDDGTVAPIEEQPSALARSIVLGAQLMEENDALKEALGFETKRAERHRANATEWECKYVRYGRELDYWERHRRRFVGRWHVTVKIDLTPWSWIWRPQWPKWSDRKIGLVQFWWLGLCIEASEA